jgi:hypothetical protein
MVFLSVSVPPWLGSGFSKQIDFSINKEIRLTA